MERSGYNRTGKYPLEDYCGKTFGRLLVIEWLGRLKNENMWLCICLCGKEKIVRQSKLRFGDTKSCGCLHKERTSKAKFRHGKKGTTEYNAWANMKKRCYNKNNSRYKTYGARGIEVCDRWLGEYGFVNFLKDMGQKPSKKHTLERVDNDKGYSPENCIWLYEPLQARNKTTSRIIEFNGETHILEEWGEITGLGKKNIWSRLNNGWTVEDALTKPLRRW